VQFFVSGERVMNRVVAWIGAAFVWLLASTAVQAGTRHYYYTDPQGTVLAKTDAAGNVVEASDYRPYGARTLGSSSNGPGYTGHVNDADSGLVYMQARYYDPAIGRFISVDPHGIEPGLVGFSRYAYGRNNPVFYIDPDGMYESPAWMRATIPGQVAWDNAVTSWQDGRPGMAVAYATSMLAEQALSVATLGGGQVATSSARAGVQLAPQAATVAEKKAAQLLTNKAAGKAAEALAAKELVAEGNTILGSQVTVKTSQGYRVIDHLIQTVEGKIVAVEVKAGGAARSATQVAKDEAMASEGAKIISKNAPKDLQGLELKIDTVVRQY
jgi:RHS repeat-associated protein